MINRVNLRSLRIRVFLCFLGVALARYLGAQEKTTGVTVSPSLQDFARRILSLDAATPPPSFDELLSVQHAIAGLPPEEVWAALPLVAQAAARGEETAKIDAAAIVLAIAQRPDSAVLMRGYVSSMGHLLTSSSALLQNAAAQILGMLKPEPPPEVTPLLLAFVRRSDRDALAQTSALAVLLRIAPTAGETMEAVDSFLARPLEPEVREAVLNGIANSKIQDVHLADIVINALTDSNEGIRFTAAQALGRMPGEAVLRAKPALERLMERTDESPEVKDAAGKALRRLAH